MHKRFVLVLSLVLATLTLHAKADSYVDDFRLWKPTGNAFDDQPLNAVDVVTNRIAPIAVGGDYWRNLSYPLGQHGPFVVATGQTRGDGPIGTLTSPPFLLVDSHPFFTVLVGGTEDLEHERIELQVLPRASEIAELEERIRRWRSTGSRTAPYVVHDGDFLTLVAFTGAGYEQLRQEIVELPWFVFGHQARIKLSDTSPGGHLNVDLPTFTSTPPAPRPTPVWGYADFHTHPMNHMAFGALKGVHTVWGVPGGNYDDYVRNPSLTYRDLPRCTTGHDGGPYAVPFLNAVQKLQYTPTLDLLFAHGKSGAPEFSDFPSFLAGTHQQMHITQIRRNYDGGLRLMVGLVTENLGAQYLVSKVVDGQVPIVTERASLEAQVAGMQDLARLNASWMQVAYTPEEARNIILHNKLALILGVEVDGLGGYYDHPEDEVAYLWGLGVRVVTPIHAVNNELGGAAVFIGPYNWLNDLVHRDFMDMSERDLDQHPAKFFETTDDSCHPESNANDGECVQLHLEAKERQRVYLGRCLESGFRESPCLKTVKGPPDMNAQGQKNSLGLTPRGQQYLRALMDRAMIIDTAHMADASVEGTYDVILQRLRLDHPECASYSWRSVSREDCNAAAYPAIISHAHFRGQALYGESDTFPPSEYDISNHNLDMLERVGGVVGPFVAESRISGSWDPSGAAEGPLKNDCAQSSKSFAYSFHYASTKVSGVGMATDFTFIPGAAPRFGTDACWAYNQAKYPQKERHNHPGRYHSTAQVDGVLYEGLSSDRDVALAPNVPLKFYQIGSRMYDINTDGVAHYGMIPDMLQDLRNLHFPREDFERLFSSAEAYIRMWEKTDRAARRRR